jgi:hypothetical protein
VVAAYQEGASAEEIVLAYDSLELPDVYTVIGYYLQNRAAVEEYLAERCQNAAEARRMIEARNPVNRKEIRERLLARRRQQSAP